MVGVLGGLSGLCILVALLGSPLQDGPVRVGLLGLAPAMTDGAVAMTDCAVLPERRRRPTAVAGGVRLRVPAPGIARVAVKQVRVVRLQNPVELNNAKPWTLETLRNPYHSTLNAGPWHCQGSGQTGQSGPPAKFQSNSTFHSECLT